MWCSVSCGAVFLVVQCFLFRQRTVLLLRQRAVLGKRKRARTQARRARGRDRSKPDDFDEGKAPGDHLVCKPVASPGRGRLCSITHVQRTRHVHMSSVLAPPVILRAREPPVT